jgi:copper resistance protein B
LDVCLYKTTRSDTGFKDLKFHIYSFYGGDYHKLLVDVEGERGLKNSEWLIERADLLFVKAISSSWDLRAGVGYARSNEGGRSKLVLGVNGPGTLRV